MCMFAQHHWPRWGKERIVEHLARHRDMYRYLHDQTLRLANRGLTPTEIAAEVRAAAEPRERTWSCRGYYGTVATTCAPSTSAIWASSTATPPTWTRIRPLEAASALRASWPAGSTQLLAKPRSAFDEGDYRWVAELCSHAVFAERGSSKSGDVEAGNAEPGDVEAGNAEPGNAEAGNAEPGNAEAGNAEPGNAEPGNAEAGDAEAGDAKPGNAESGNAESGNAESGKAESGKAEAGNAEARELQASALEQLGYQSESAVWRNLYLVGAHELREGPPQAPRGGEWQAPTWRGPCRSSSCGMRWARVWTARERGIRGSSSRGTSPTWGSAGASPSKTARSVPSEGRLAEEATQR